MGAGTAPCGEEVCKVAKPSGASWGTEPPGAPELCIRADPDCPRAETPGRSHCGSGACGEEARAPTHRGAQGSQGSGQPPAPRAGASWEWELGSNCSLKPESGCSSVPPVMGAPDRAGDKGQCTSTQRPEAWARSADCSRNLHPRAQGAQSCCWLRCRGSPAAEGTRAPVSGQVG